MENFIQENQYIGKQILIDSDRLVFNGRDDSIFSSQNGFLFKTKGEFHINTKKDSFINTNKIYIGPVIDGKDPNIPAVKSDELKLMLGILIDELVGFFTVQYPQTSGLQGPNPAVNKALAQNLINRLIGIKNNYLGTNSPIESKNVFIR
jgi:hypothetical protein